jgi:uncharacterized repeat protein (TIGR01451 family)
MKVRLAWLVPAMVAFAAVIAAAAPAATPSSGTIGPPDGTSVTWTGPERTASTTGPSDGECSAPGTPGDPTDPGGFCDDFSLTVNVPQRQGSFTVDVTGTAPAEDYDLYVYDGHGDEVASSGLPGSVESATVDCPSPTSGPYHIRVVYFTTVSTGTGAPGYTGTATYHDQACPVTPPDRTATFNNDALTFAPSTIVSAHFLGGEPQTTLERRESWTPSGAPVDNNRVFVDWPLSSRSNIGQLNRSLDGGDSFRLLFDPICAVRSRPNCATGGGGDTEEDVNLVNGHVLFSDQEALANEAYAASTDHGDTFLTQTPVPNATTATDRQWLAATDNTAQTVAGQTIEAFFSYHVPPNAYVQAVTTDTDLPVPQPAPQLNDVGQSGQPRVDNNPGSPGHGWIYYPYAAFRGGGTWVATARSADYVDPTKWHATQVTPNAVDSFPWVAVDHHGNAYLTWDSGGAVYYSYSSIDAACNNPGAGGTPGTCWSPRARITPPNVGSAVFPEVTAGDNGRIGVTYIGTTEFTGVPDDAGTSVKWNTYAAVITNAASDTPVVNTGIVSHRISHQGNICSGGTFCGLPGVGDPSKDDRSLADMIDVSFDGAGRLGVIYQDNYSNSFQNTPDRVADLSPFDHFAKQTSGPSVLANASIAVSLPRDARDDPSGDATWPNRAYTNPGINLPALDATRTALVLADGKVTAQLKLADATVAGMQRDLAAYSLACPLCQQAERLQYVVRFESASEVYHLSLEVLPNGTLHYFGGKLDANDGILNPASPTSVIAAGYHRDFDATGSVQNGTVTISAPASAFGLGAGAGLFSVTGFSMAGPLEANETLASNIMRTVDATPPFDTTLQERADLSVVKTGPATGRVGVAMTYTIKVTNGGPSSATGVTMKDTLPKNAGYASSTRTQGTCTAGKGTVTCSLGNLAAGATATITVTVKPTAKGAAVDTATVTSTSPIDPNQANNTSSVTTTVR